MINLPPMRQFLLLIAVFAVQMLSAQSLAPLIPSGPMPELYRCASHTVVDAQIARRDAAGDPVSPAEQDFMREMSYYSQQRMFSGWILFNDSLSDYVQRVGDEVLKNDSATRSQLHFYVYKDADPNAFTSATGTIIITVGLLAQLENEAQLAYILCHEITHYRNQHMLKGYLNREELKNNTSTPYYLLQSNALSYSQEQELEADMQGFDLFLQSPYSKKEALRSFDVLEYSNLPFDDMPFDTMFFNIDYLKVPVGYYKKEVDPIYSDDNYDDQNSTHPNVRKRRMALMSVLDTVKNKEGKLFIISKNDFLNVREASRYELCRLYLDEREYPDAIYASYMMLQKHPDDIYFKKIIARSIYEIAAYEQNGKSSYDPYGYYGGFFSSSYGGKYSALNHTGYYGIPDMKDHPGQQQQIYSLFSTMDPDELTCLALAYNWNIYKLDTKDSLESTLCDSLFSMLVNKQNLHISYFSTITPDSARTDLREDSLARVAETGETGDSKFSRLDKFKLSSEKERFTKFAFVNQLKDSAFVDRFRYYTEHRRSWVEYYDTGEGNNDGFEVVNDDQYGYGIDRIIIAGPDYEMYRENKRGEDPDQDYTQSEIGAANLTTVLANEASAAGVQTVIMNPYTMNTMTGDTFSDLATINEWFYERIQHGSHPYAWNISNQLEADSIASKYHTRYVMFTSVEATYYKKIEHPVWYGISCVTVVPLVKLFIPQRKYVYDVAILDLKTGEVIDVDNRRFHKGKENDRTSQFYSDLFKMMKKAKEPAPKETGDVQKDVGK
jgi:Zn-dependent protease with chaperone function